MFRPSTRGDVVTAFGTDTYGNRTAGAIPAARERRLRTAGQRSADWLGPAAHPSGRMRAKKSQRYSTPRRLPGQPVARPGGRRAGSGARRRCSPKPIAVASISRRNGRIVELEGFEVGWVATRLLQFCCNYCPNRPSAATIIATRERGVKALF